MQSLGGLDFDENLVVDDHVHHLRRERVTAKVDGHCHLSIDAVARLGQKDFQRSRVDELSISEAEFLMSLVHRADDVRGQFTFQEVFRAPRHASLSPVSYTHLTLPTS